MHTTWSAPTKRDNHVLGAGGSPQKRGRATAKQSTTPTTKAAPATKGPNIPASNLDWLITKNGHRSGSTAEVRAHMARRPFRIVHAANANNYTCHIQPVTPDATVRTPVDGWELLATWSEQGIRDNMSKRPTEDWVTEVPRTSTRVQQTGSQRCTLPTFQVLRQRSHVRTEQGPRSDAQPREGHPNRLLPNFVHRLYGLSSTRGPNFLLGRRAVGCHHG